MSYHHYNRVLDHPENPLLENLTALEFAVLLTIAGKINAKDPSKMRFSNAHLAYLTRHSENAIQRATAGLVTKGALVIVGDRKARQATLYAVAIECPAECQRKRKHYTPLELSEHRERLSDLSPQNVVSDPQKSGYEGDENTAMPPLNVVTNKQLINNSINENKKPSEFASEQTPEVLSFETFEQMLDRVATRPEAVSDHYLVCENSEKAYRVALDLLAKKGARGDVVKKPVTFLEAIFERNPLRLLGGEPGSKARNADYADRVLAEQSQTASNEYIEEIWNLCAFLGIDYEELFAATTMERTLRKHHREGTLTWQIVAWAHNQVCEPSEQSFWAPSEPYDPNTLYTY